MNGSFSFWVKSYTDLYGLDSYTVAVSVTDNQPGSFTVISGPQPLQTTTAWVKKTFNLSAYNNQKVYLAIQCVSNDNFLMMIDDLEVKPQSSTTITADFTADKTSVRVGEKVSFTDQSSGVPVSWNWKFTGGSPSTSNMQNPVDISYSIPGTYPVSLKVSNGLNSDSLTRPGFITVTGYPTTLFQDFESFGDFTLYFNPWTAIDVKGGNTYGINQANGSPYLFPHTNEPMAYICFNPSQTNPPMTDLFPHSGQKLGCCFSSVPPMNPNNKWLITPKVSLGSNPKIEFWVMAYNNIYGDEKYNVAVSTSDANPSSFVPVNTTPEIAPSAWTKRSYLLSDFSNQDVYIGIQCVTDNSFIFMIDDISVTSSLGVSEPNPLIDLSVFPNPAKDHIMLNCPTDNSLPYSIELVSLLGTTVSTWSETPVFGRIMLGIHGIPAGIYVLNIRRGSDMVSLKVSILN
jgi:PKD repeat protein